MRVAAVISSALHLGGGFQQELSTAVTLNEAKFEGIEFVFISTRPENVDVLAQHGITARHIPGYLLDRVLLEARRSLALRRILSKVGLGLSKFEKTLLSMGIDLVYFLSPNLAALKLSRIGYFFTVWDLCHRDFVEFPEVSADGEFELREFLFRAALPKAVSIFADSEQGKVNLMSRYGLDGHRIRVAPFLPSEGVMGTALNSGTGNDVSTKFDLKRPFIFYPAQFWSHKNHVVILDALACLQTEYGVVMDAVFCGSDKGNLQYVLDYAKSCGVHEQVRYLGFVDTGDLVGLYHTAVGLVMPTYFGPTNIPPLEAFAMDCTVFYAKLPGTDVAYREAVFEFNNEDPAGLAATIIKALNEPELCKTKKQAGTAVLRRFRRSDYEQAVGEAISDYRAKVRCFKSV